MAAPVYYTADMVRALPDDGNRYEAVHGELLVTPSPRPLHQVVLERVRGLSPSTARSDRFTKRRLYQEVGVAQYWIVDPEARTVEVWTPADKFPASLDSVLTWHPSGAEVPFTLELRELFRPL